MKKIKILLTVLLLAQYLIQAQTEVSGGIFSSTTWSIENAPYLVTDDVVVFDEVSLTIEPGVTVKFYEDKLLEVRGKIIAIGSDNSTIKFTSNSDNPYKGIWNGILFKNSLVSELNFVEIEYADSGICTVGSDYDEFNVFNSIFSFNKTAAYIDASETNNFENCRFEENDIAINGIQFSYIKNCEFINNATGIGYITHTDLENCIFTGHTEVAVIAYGTTIRSNTFTNNNVGLNIKLFSSSIIQDNIISNNSTGLEVRGASGSPVNGFYNNCIYDNSPYNIIVSEDIGLNLSNNYWGVTDSLLIENSIYHAVDDLSLGFVNFMPFQNECMAETNNNVKEKKSLNTLQVFPNPIAKNSDVFCEIKNSGNYSLSIIDFKGAVIQRISTKFIEKGNYLFDLNSRVKKGIYYLMLEGENEIYSSKIIVL